MVHEHEQHPLIGDPLPPRPAGRFVFPDFVGPMQPAPPYEGGYLLKIQRLNEHTEYSASKLVCWKERNHRVERRECSPAERARLDALNVARSVRRSKKLIRQKIKCAGLTDLLTLTYRENQLDRALAFKHLNEFKRRLTRALGYEFRYVATAEQQQRGAWHLHLAIDKLPRFIKQRGAAFGVAPSWNVVRDIWRSVVGPLGGNIDVSRGSKCTTVDAKARYMAKYFSKDWDGRKKGQRRFSSSPIDIPPPIRFYATRFSYIDALGYLFDNMPAEQELAWGGVYTSVDQAVIYFASGPPRRI